MKTSETVFKLPGSKQICSCEENDASVVVSNMLKQLTRGRVGSHRIPYTSSFGRRRRICEPQQPRRFCSVSDNMKKSFGKETEGRGNSPPAGFASDDPEWIGESDFQANFQYDLTSEHLDVKPSEKKRWVWLLKGYDDPPRPNQMQTQHAEDLRNEGFDMLGQARSTEHMVNKTNSEMAIVGKSNVGKSSLINAIIGAKTRSGRGGSAVVSKKPGRTTSIFSYGIGRNDDNRSMTTMPDFRYILVDHPGYGYADVPEHVVENLSKIIRNYYVNRDSNVLIGSMLLIDARTGLKPFDESMAEMFEELSIMYMVVMTKCDLVKEAELDRNVAKISNMFTNARFRSVYPRIFGTSANLGIGKGNRGKLEKKFKKYNRSVPKGNLDRLRAELVMLADSRGFKRKLGTKRVLRFI